MEYVKLGDIAKVVAGSTAPKDNQFNDSTGLPFIRAGHLEALCNNYDLRKLPKVDESNPDIKKQVRVPKNTIIFAKSGMSCMKARVYQTTDESYIVNHLAGIICGEKVNPSYLKYYFMINKPNRLVIDESYPSIRLNDICNMNIYIPNLKIQEKIANTLDKSNDLINKRKQQIKLLDELIKSRFIEIFGDPVTNPKGWRYDKLENVTYKITDGKHGDCQNEENSGYYFISAKDINDRKIYTDNARQITKEDFDETNKRTRLQVDDIVIVNTGVTIGKTAIATKEDVSKNLTFQKSVAIVTVNPSELINKFLEQYIAFDRERIYANASGSAQKNWLLSQMRSYKIMVPPIELQNEFTDFVKQVDKLKFKMENSLKELEDNFNSLMQKAFKGELFN